MRHYLPRLTYTITFLNPLPILNFSLQSFFNGYDLIFIQKRVKYGVHDHYSGRFAGKFV